MKVNTAEFIISAVASAQYPQDALPEIALAGRSNVGKSSFINRMLNRKNIARTSSRPGKTQTLNFFKINEQFYFVDVPGYGFARVSKTEKEKWGKMIEEYFVGRDPLRAVVQLVDLRHPPTADDKAMYEFLKFYHIPVVIVATKADKISKGQLQKHQKIVKETLGLQSGDSIVLFSSETGQGKDEAWKQLLAQIKRD
ncbi:YihA family ribosome biogenesis GTP-binding protein [Ammoniphilus oxalaticus]|uniref:Probable GTP-binding protein EngB n=1 Tax=Ammoniphilus oxalaticus TaxID=66863 RepID=A0A419SIM9_9BACL|nr:ribosome biogenesis GTP-binding protein YihA/YsxC [Ammoniphilus oxalaticus]RKD23863.1 YihA family ribosome biogenesis GTP-binding protein [Ammoniphilus oxalaticus]